MSLSHPSRWSYVRLSRRHLLPEVGGVYAVMAWGKILYIGRTKNLKARWKGSGHHRYWLAKLLGAHLRYFETPAHKRVEGELIKQYSPPWNYTKVPMGAEQDNPWLGYLGAILWMLFAKRNGKPEKQEEDFWEYWLQVGMVACCGVAVVIMTVDVFTFIFGR